MLASPPAGVWDYHGLSAGLGVQPFNRLVSWRA
jgi:hypothetical protein